MRGFIAEWPAKIPTNVHLVSPSRTGSQKVTVDVPFTPSRDNCIVFWNLRCPALISRQMEITQKKLADGHCVCLYL